MPNDDEYELFNSNYYQTLPDSDEPIKDDDETKRLIHTTNSEQTPKHPPVEVHHNSIKAKEDYDYWLILQSIYNLNIRK